MKSKLLLLLFISSVVNLSCKKEKSENISKTELLTSKTWVVLKAEEKQNTLPWEDTFPQWFPCIKDNYFKFKTDFTVEYNEAANACSGNTPNQILDTSTWSFTENETKIITGGVINVIEKLDKSILIVSTSETVGGNTYLTRTTYGH